MKKIIKFQRITIKNLLGGYKPVPGELTSELCAPSKDIKVTCLTCTDCYKARA